MTINICAVPYAYDVPFFYFESKEEYDEKYQKNFEKYHCEEYEFQYIDGDELLDILWTALGSENVFKILEIYEEGIIDNERDARALEVCLTLLGMDIDEALSSYDDIYLFWGNTEEYAYVSFPWHEVPEHLHSYVDIDSYKNDLECGGELYDLGNGYIFIRTDL